MCIFPRLIQIYRKQGFEIRTGLNPYHFNNYRDAPFTAIYKKGEILLTGGGISLQEIYFFECLFRSFKPENIFIIGNAFGWSTVLMALLNPNGQVVALDAGIEGDFGIRLTNKIAEEEKLNIKVVKGFSPNNVSKTVAENFSTGIDFAFIDGLHTNVQQKLDFNAVFNLCHKNCIYVFHDVVNWKMMQSFQQIGAVSGRNADVLYRTPSGMGILYPDQVSIETKECIQAFSEKRK